MRKDAKYFDCQSCKLPSNASILLKEIDGSNSSSIGEKSDSNESLYSPEDEEKIISWAPGDYHDFCTELNLSKKMSLKCLKMLRSDPVIKQRLEVVQTADISNRSKSFLRFFTTQDSYTFCNDINGLKTELNYQAVNEEWCLFLDSSKSSLKAALICDKYKFPTLPVAYCHAKEDRESIRKLLELLDYKNLNLPIVADLKVINFLLGLKSGFAKYPCFYCEFDSRNSEKDFEKGYVWDTKQHFPFEQLVDPDHIIFPFLHLKLGIFQKFIKSLDNCGTVIEYLKKKFQKSEAKTINGIFTGPESILQSA